MEGKSKLIRICPELIEVFEEIRENIKEYSWGADVKLSNYDISKILAKKVKTKKGFFDRNPT